MSPKSGNSDIPSQCKQDAAVLQHTLEAGSQQRWGLPVLLEIPPILACVDFSTEVLLCPASEIWDSKNDTGAHQRRPGPQLGWHAPLCGWQYPAYAAVPADGGDKGMSCSCALCWGSAPLSPGHSWGLLLPLWLITGTWPTWHALRESAWLGLVLEVISAVLQERERFGW